MQRVTEAAHDGEGFGWMRIIPDARHAFPATEEREGLAELMHPAALKSIAFWIRQRQRDDRDAATRGHAGRPSVAVRAGLRGILLFSHPERI